MPHQVRLSGQIADVFAHRFVVDSNSKQFLADIGPKAAEQIDLQVGDKVDVEGDQKPSDIKVSRLSIEGRAVAVEWPGPKLGPKHKDKHPPFRLELSAAVKAAEDAGYEVVGDPKRGPKHFELLVRKDGLFSELHIHEDGAIRNPTSGFR